MNKENLKIFILALTLTIPLIGKTQNKTVYSDSTYNLIKTLKEFVVSAERRQLQTIDIPNALSVINEQMLTQDNNTDLRSLSGLVPNFYMQSSGLKLSTPIYVRGIGTVSGTPSVGLYIDGVPVFDKNAFVFDLYDIEQIEMLRGPQTTLYGRNSINGLINIITKTAEKTFSTKFKLSYGSFNSQNYNCIINFSEFKKTQKQAICIIR